MRAEIFTADAREILMDDIFSQFEEASHELKNEGFELTPEDILEIERECKNFFDSKK